MFWTATNSEGYPSPAALAVDAVVLTVRDGRLDVLVVRSDGGRRALPGGFVTPDEDPAGAAVRVLEQKTALTRLYLEQLGAFAAPGRDPRGWIPSIAHLALVPPATQPNDDQTTWVNAHGRHRWAFDHREIVRAALDRIQGKLWWSNVAVGVLPHDFSLSQARQVYQAIARTTYDGATFARDLKATGLIQPTGQTTTDSPGRPAALYRYTTTSPAWGSGRRKRVPPG